MGYRARSARWAMVMGAATTQWPMPTATWPTWPVYCFWPTCVVSPLSHIIVALVADAAAIVVAAVTVVIIVSRLLYTNALAQHFWQPPEKGSNKFDFAQLR